MNASARRLAPLLAALAMIGPFSIDTFFPAFKAMELHFGVSPAAMQQTISVYLAVYSVMALLHGPLSDAFGRRRIVLGFVALFAFASLGCTFAPSFGALLFFRALQGVAAGAGLIVSRAIIRDRFDGPDAQRLMSQITLIFGVAPALAPVIGGWLLALSNSWRPLFGFLTGFGLVLLAWCAWRLPETLAPERRVPINARTLLTNYFAMLSDAPFRWLSLTAGFNFGALFLYISSAPAFVLDLLKLGEQDFAWLFVPAIGGMMIGATISGRLAGKRTPPEMMRLSYRLIAAGAVVNLAVNLLFPPGVPWSVLPIGLGARDSLRLEAGMCRDADGAGSFSADARRRLFAADGGQPADDVGGVGLPLADRLAPRPADRGDRGRDERNRLRLLVDGASHHGPRCRGFAALSFDPHWLGGRQSSSRPLENSTCAREATPQRP